MVRETINGAFRYTNLKNEPDEYLPKREQLRLAEIDLMRQRERVAEMRCQLPPGAILEDYVSEEVRQTWMPETRRSRRFVLVNCSPEQTVPWSCIN